MLGSIHIEVVSGLGRLLAPKPKDASSLINDTKYEDDYIKKLISSSEDHQHDTSSNSILQESIENISKSVKEVFSEPVQIVESTSLTAVNESSSRLPDLTFTEMAHNTTAFIANSLEQKQASTVVYDYPREETPVFTGLVHNTTAFIENSLQQVPTIVLSPPGGGGEPANDPIGELAINASLKKEADSKPFSLSFNGFITEEPSSNNSFNRILIGVAMAASAFFIGKFAYKAYQRRREQTSEKMPVQAPRVYQVKKRTKQRKQLDIHFQPSAYSAPLRTYKNPVNPTVFRGNSTSFM
jgi:hypothetical protein